MNDAVVIAVEDSLSINTVGHFAIESIQIESNLLRVVAQVTVAQLVRVSVERTMHLPEFTLGRCRFGGFSRRERAWMDIYERKVSMYEAYCVHQLVEHLFHFAMSAVTVRTFIVTVVNYSNERIGRANRMIMFVNGNG